MDDKKQLELALLIFAICTIFYCTAFAFIIGIERANFENKIKELNKKIILKEKDLINRINLN